MSPEQYRTIHGFDPVLPERKTEPWPDPEAWDGWTMPWPPPTVIVLTAEVTDTFLWNRSPGRDPLAEDYVLDPGVLGVTARLSERLRSWNGRYGMGINEAWWDEGWTLAHDLQCEFDQRGLNVEVLFHDVAGEERAVRDEPHHRRRR